MFFCSDISEKHAVHRFFFQLNTRNKNTGVLAWFTDLRNSHEFIFLAICGGIFVSIKSLSSFALWAYQSLIQTLVKMSKKPENN